MVRVGAVMMFMITVQQVTSQSSGPLCCAINEPLFDSAGGAAAWFWRKLRCPRPAFRLPPWEDTQQDIEFSPQDCKASPDVCRIQPLSPPDALIKCLHVGPPATPADPVDWTDDSPAHMQPVATWRSNKVTAQPFTVVTQLTMDRMLQLWAQCKSWRGPLSAVVHMAILPQEEPNASQLLRCAIRQVGMFFIHVEGTANMCALDVTLVVEQQQEHVALKKYPINALRNIARLQARTEALLLLDVDLLLAAEFSSPTAEKLHPVAALCREKAVVVLPAFDVFLHNKAEAADMADKLVAGNKDGLLAAVAAGNAGLFDSRRFPVGHAATNLSRWRKANQFYQIDYAARFEPFLAISRVLSPWHDARFRGYGQNKIVHIAHLDATGHKFIVHPTAYIVHRAHEMSPARIQFARDMDQYVRSAREKAPQQMSMFVKVNTQFTAAKRQMLEGTFVPVVAPSTEACRKQLSWWS